MISFLFQVSKLSTALFFPERLNVSKKKKKIGRRLSYQIFKEILVIREIKKLLASKQCF